MPFKCHPFIRDGVKVTHTHTKKQQLQNVCGVQPSILHRYLTHTKKTMLRHFLIVKVGSYFINWLIFKNNKTNVGKVIAAFFLRVFLTFKFIPAPLHLSRKEERQSLVAYTANKAKWERTPLIIYFYFITKVVFTSTGAFLCTTLCRMLHCIDCVFMKSFPL